MNATISSERSMDRTPLVYRRLRVLLTEIGMYCVGLGMREDHPVHGHIGKIIDLLNAEEEKYYRLLRERVAIQAGKEE